MEHIRSEFLNNILNKMKNSHFNISMTAVIYILYHADRKLVFLDLGLAAGLNAMESNSNVGCVCCKKALIR